VSRRILHFLKLIWSVRRSPFSLSQPLFTITWSNYEAFRCTSVVISLIFWLLFVVAKSLVWQIIVPIPSVSFPFPLVPQDLAPVLLVLPVPVPPPSFPFPRVPLFFPGAPTPFPFLLSLSPLCPFLLSQVNFHLFPPFSVDEPTPDATNGREQRIIIKRLIP
jgi:hypothetical protein